MKSVFVGRAAKHPQHVFTCSSSDISATERSVPPLGFHEVIHFSSHTLTFIPNTLLMSAGGDVDEGKDRQGIK